MKLRRISAENYHADPCTVPSLSSSIAHTLISRSPLHAWLQHPRLGGAARVPTKSMDKGSLVHCLLLDAGRGIVIVRADDWRTKAARESREAARDSGMLAVLESEYNDALEAAAQIRKRIADFDIRLDGESECAAFWKETADDGSEVSCRAMIDHWVEATGRIYDLKTSRSAHPKACAAHMMAYGYEIQAVAYTRALTQLYPGLAGRIDFVDIFCEVEPPYSVTPAMPASSMLELGERRWLRAVNTWAECLRANHWPSYTTEIVRIEAPPWALTQELDIEYSAQEQSSPDAAHAPEPHESYEEDRLF